MVLNNDTCGNEDHAAMVSSCESDKSVIDVSLMTQSSSSTNDLTTNSSLCVLSSPKSTIKNIELNELELNELKLKLKKSIDVFETRCLDVPYRSKMFYGKEWLFQKINDHTQRLQAQLTNDEQQQAPTVLTLIGDSGNGKTHICCELKWPTQETNMELSTHILSVYFLNIYLNKNALVNFYNYIKLSIYSVILNKTRQRLHDINDDLTAHQGLCDVEPIKLADKFIDSILKPISHLNVTKNYYILIDGVDETLLQETFIKSKCTNSPLKTPKQSQDSQENDNLLNDLYKYTQNKAILQFLNRIFKFFPKWLHLILTCKRVNEKKIFKKYFTQTALQQQQQQQQQQQWNFKISIDIPIVNGMNSVRRGGGVISSSESFNDKQKLHIQEDPKPKSDIMSKSLISATNSISETPTSTSSKSSKSSSNNSSKNDITDQQAATAITTMTGTSTTSRNSHTSTFKDIQVYILKRLDNDYELKIKFNKLNAVDMLNLLLIKSNYCILYVEKIFDLILHNLINSREIRDIPVTLYGLYLFLIERILNDMADSTATATTLATSTPTSISEQMSDSNETQPTKKEIMFSIFNITITTLKPICKTKLYNLLKLRYLNLNYSYYENLFNLIQPILFRKYTPTNDTTSHSGVVGEDGDTETYVLYHTSFIEWFTDVKFCTAKYLFNINEGHFIMSLYYLKNLRFKQLEQEFKATNCNDLKMRRMNDDTNNKKDILRLINKFKLNLFNSFPLITSIEFNYLYSFISMFNQCFEFDFNPSVLFEFVKKGDLENVKLLVEKGMSIELTDGTNQTPILIATKSNQCDVLRYLVKIKNINLDHCDSDGWTALRYASWTGSEDIVQVLLEHGACVNACDSEGRTALRAAVFANHENIVKLLVKYGANVNKCDVENRSVLQIACIMGHISLIYVLIRNGANINHKDQNGRNCLSLCISNKATESFELIKFLLDNNVNINDCDVNNQNALILAVKQSLYDVVLLLLNSNIDIDCIDNDGLTAISYAIQMNAAKIIEILLEYDAATHILDKEGRSILSLACQCQCEAGVRMLMEKGLDEMHKDNFGWTPLHEATYTGNAQIVKMLLEYGSDVDDCDNESKTSLFYACQEGHLSIVRILVEHHARLTQRSHDGNTPFRVACLQGHQKVCEYLLSKSDSIDLKDPDGRTTLYCLVLLSKRIDMIEFLLKHGANVNERDTDGRTCMHIAAHVGAIDIVRLLLKYTPNIEATDNGGRTPLLIASWNDKLSVVKELLSAQANVNHVDSQGATPLSIASQKGNYEIVNELLSHGALINRSSRNPIKLALRGGFSNCAQLLQSNLILQQITTATATVQSQPRTSKSYDSFRFHNSERKILATLNSMNSKELQTATVRTGLQTSYSMSNQIKSYANENSTHQHHHQSTRTPIDTLKSTYYVEPSYRILKPDRIIEDYHEDGCVHLEAQLQSSPVIKQKIQTNNKILQILRKKFKFFHSTSHTDTLTKSTDTTPQSPHPHMTRSVTDTLTTIKQIPAASGTNNSDDSAYILNRTSLNNYFSQQNSFKQYNRPGLFSNDTKSKQTHGLTLNSFKKETSI